MTLREKIQCMEAFERGEEIEVNFNGTEFDGWIKDIFPSWNWAENDYRIKHKPKQVVIEKWLCNSKDDKYYVIEGTLGHISHCFHDKIKLLDTYEVEI